LGAAASALALDPASKPEIVVYAATSTRDALQAVERIYERDHAVDLVFNFGSSGDLANQIVAAAKADVFLSADEREMDKVGAAGLVVPGTRRPLLSNQLVVIEPVGEASRFTLPFDAAQLATARIRRLSLGNVETVPAGRYAKAWLEARGVWPAVAERVLPGIDVRAALAAVESAAADAGIVYRTDVARSAKARVVYAVPVEEGSKIAYPVAVIAPEPTADRAQARAFIEFLGSPSARTVFEDAGFVALPAPHGRRP
jgi:molybdate transport system substrate-binding protein